eukprot:1197755-Prymnesium_polylepis.1
MAESIRELSDQRIVRADRRGLVGAMGDRARGSRWSEAASWPQLLAVLIGIGLNSRPTSAPAPVPPCSRTDDSCRCEALTHTIRRLGG